MTDEEMAELAAQVDKVKGPLGEIGRLGVRYPGENVSHFPKEEPLDDDNESPYTDEEITAHIKRERDLLNPMKLSPEGQARLKASTTPEEWQKLKQRALDAM